MTVVALGSINMDLVVKTPRLPDAGETLIGHEFFSAFGGKGANQAVAVAKLGVPVYFVGQVGGDDFGQTLLLALKASGVKTDSVRVNPDIHSGVASIVISETGDNTIACAAGANGAVGELEVEAFGQRLQEANVALLELGIPGEAVAAAARKAKQQGVLTILDPAPVPESLPPDLLSSVDIITPNELEASQLVGFSVCDRTLPPEKNRQTLEQAAQHLQQRGVKTVIITLGDQGVFCATPNEQFWEAPLPVQVVDTVAAGDAFNGALATALVARKPYREAVHWGNIAGAIAVTKTGAQSSLPDQSTFFSRLEAFPLSSQP
ncbi:ribokinase [Spirulina sp. CS-785/01]|uniref:ribokinase n=1 Tax=Spirulina sp. CS-785/01 TaxID=3021716 RepID=UPI00232DE208|nr:ribokinase [Spirulina sp. CS-785/01]MDB9313669.1 ribokinase [Spirulina sp. CS-785/01]